MALKRFPGFIDPHVHLRDPGATHKEDFGSGARAAAAGGFTFVLDMPNNPTPTTSIERLEEKVALATEKSVVDLGFNYGTDGKNLDTFADAAASPHVFGLKLYCNHTTGEMLLQDIHLLEGVFRSWQSEKPILVHAEGTELAAALTLAHLYDRRLHVCHISQAVEVELVRRAKAKGQQVTSGVCPHHLFLTNNDVEKLGSHAIMKPPLGTPVDQAELWNGLNDGTIDIIETDHAPHTAQEKEGDAPPFGVPGLETAVGLLYLAVHDGRIPADLVPKLLHDSAQEIFNIPEQPDTFVELDPDEAWIVGPPFAGKTQWSPFDGWEVYGKIHTVTLRGRKLVEDGKVVV